MKALIHFTIIILFIPYLLNAKELTVYFPDKMPPWAIQKSNTGIAPELIKTILEDRGYTIISKYVPLPRLSKQLNKRESDVVTMIESKELDGNYSNIVSYFNAELISLKRNNFQINNLEDLKNKSIIAFKGAHSIFKEFHELSESNSKYLEMNNQRSQVMMLFDQRVDFILLDKKIFLYWKNNISKNISTNLQCQFNDLSFTSMPQKNPFYFVFKDIKIRNEFNEGLKQLKSNGDYDKLLTKYNGP